MGIDERAFAVAIEAMVEYRSNHGTHWSLEALQVFTEAYEATRQQPSERVDDDLPDYWKEAIGGTYTMVKLGKHEASHPITVKRILEQHKGTEAADVIVALVFSMRIAENRSQHFADQLVAQAPHLANLEEANARIKELTSALEVTRNELWHCAKQLTGGYGRKTSINPEGSIGRALEMAEQALNPKPASQP